MDALKLSLVLTFCSMLQLAFAQMPPDNMFKIEQRGTVDNPDIKGKTPRIADPKAMPTLQLIKQGELNATKYIPSNKDQTLPDKISASTAPNGDVFITWQSAPNSNNWDGRAVALSPLLNTKWGEVVYTNSAKGGDIRDQATVSFANGRQMVAFAEYYKDQFSLQFSVFTLSGMAAFPKPIEVPIEAEDVDITEVEALLMPGGLAAMLAYVYSYNDEGDTRYALDFVIVNPAGEVLIGPMQVKRDDKPISHLGACEQADNTILLSYFNSDGQTYVVDPYGQASRKEQRFTSNQLPITDITPIPLDNGNTLLLYKDSFDANNPNRHNNTAMFVLLDPYGKGISRPAALTGQPISGLKAMKMRDGNIFLVTFDTKQNGYAYLMGQDVKIKNGPEQFCENYSPSGGGIAITQLLKDQVFLVYKTQPGGKGTDTRILYKVFQ